MKYIILFLIYILIIVPVQSQTLDIFDIDASEFPIMKAKFFAFDDKGEQLTDLTVNDFSIQEENNVRKILSVTCNSNVSMEPVSTVLVMDASGSMLRRNLDLAKSAARAWINAMPEGESECAITAFDFTNYLIQDFTNLKPLLLLKVDELFARGGTNYNAAFIDDLWGGLVISRRAKNKKVIVMMTDGRPTSATLEHAIIDEAIRQEAIIYAVTLGMPCPPVLQTITLATGGQWFEDVSTAKQAAEIYNQILQMVSGVEACEITWESDVSCYPGDRLTEVNFYPFNMTKFITYPMPNFAVTGIVVNPESVFFKNVLPGTSKDTTVTITANNGDMIVSDIMLDNPAFEIFPSAFRINKGETQSLKLTYTAPQGGNYIWTRINVFNNLCPTQLFASGGFAGKRPEKPTLVLNHPNGEELFIAGSDTVITWGGIPETDNVRLEYSTDKGNSWINVAESASGGNYHWIRIPRTPSTECLMKVSQIKVDEGNSPEWARGMGNDSYFNIRPPHSGLAIDIYENIYISSQFTGTIRIEGKTINSRGKEDIFVAKLNPRGELEWITQLGGPESDVATGIVVDLFGSCYISGRFTQSLTFDDRTLNSRGESDILIAKILPDGTIEWAKNPGGSGEDFANDIAIDQNGNLLITGSYSQTGFFDQHNVTSAGGLDIFIAKYSTEGTCHWVRSNGGIFHDEGTAVVFNQNGDIYATGKFSKSARFGTTNLTSSGTSPEISDFEIYVARYFSNGSMNWVIKAGGEGDDEPFAIAIDSNGDLFLTGRYNKTAKFGEYEITAKTISENDPTDIFLAKILANGTFYWLRSAGGNSHDAAYDIAIDNDDNIIIAGEFSNSAAFEEVILTSQGFIDAFVAKYDKSGKLEWAKSAGGPYVDNGLSLVLDEWGNSYVGGNYTGGGGFGSKILKSNMGLMDFFVWGAGGGNDALQSDVSNTVWTIAAPMAEASNVDMGKAYLGSERDSLFAEYLKNIGSYQFKVDSIFFDGDEKDAFSIVSKYYDISIEANSFYDVEFRFNPVKAGINKSSIIIYTQSDTLRRNIVGEGLLPDLQVISRFIDFGKVIVGDFKDSTAAPTIVNNSKNSIEITETRHYKPNDKDFSTIAGAGPFILNPGDTAKLDLRFTPSEKGRTSGSLEFHYDGFGSPAIIQLGGEGINPNASILVSNNYFDDIFCESTSSAEVQFSNKGGDDLIISSIDFSGLHGSDFSANQTFPLVVPPERTAFVEIVYNSDIPGLKSSDMVIRSNSNPDSVHTVPITIMMHGAKAVSDVEKIDFGILDLNEPAETIIILSNPGNHPTLFIIKAPENLNIDKESVQMQPKQNAELKINYLGNSEAMNLAEYIIITDTLCKFETLIPVNAVISKRERPIISVNAKDIGLLQCDLQKSEIIKISNLGREDLVIDEIKITGVDKDDFIIDGFNKNVLAQNESTDIVLNFIPKSSGVKNAAIEIKSNSELNPELIIPLTARYEPTQFELSITQNDLGRIIQGTKADVKIEITNSGTTANKFIINNDNNSLEFISNKVIVNSNETVTLTGILNTDDMDGNFSINVSVSDTICNLTNNVTLVGFVTNATTITLKVASAEAFAGERIEIPITFQNLNSEITFNTINFDLSFNSTLLVPEYNADYIDLNGIGTLKLRNIPFNQTGNLLVIPFITGLGNSEISSLEISNISNDNQELNFRAENGTFTSLGICYEGGARLINPKGIGGIVNISPNPATNEVVSITINSIEKGNNTLEIYNSNGYLKETLKISDNPGTYTVLLNIEDFESGVYYIQFVTPTINEVKKIVIVK